MSYFNPSFPGLPELHKTLGGGQICPTIKNFSNIVENPFFQSLPEFVLHQNNNCQGWLCKKKL